MFRRFATLIVHLAEISQQASPHIPLRGNIHLEGLGWFATEIVSGSGIKKSPSPFEAYGSYQIQQYLTSCILVPPLTL